MKIRHIIRSAVALLLFLSCTEKEKVAESPCAEGTMTVVVTQMDAADEDRISTVRFIVFDDPAADPALEVNRLFDGSEFDTGGASGDEGVSRLNIVLEVWRRPDGQDSKLVVVIANEPPSMTALLDAVTLPAELEEIRLDFADFLNADHQTLTDDTPLPMTAAVWTDKVYATEEEAAADMVAIELQRAVARVDVYLEPDDPGLILSAGTSVTLGNTFDSQYLIYHTDGTNTLGQIQTVSSGFMERVWELTEEDVAVPETQLLCSFYTPERTCSQPGDADKLILTLAIRTSDGALREGSTVISSAVNVTTGVTAEVTAVERNSVYRVTASLGAEIVTVWVNDWNGEDIYNEL